LFCALVRLACGLSLDFTPWALASSAAWIPSGVCTIIAVPLIGVGSAVLLTSATGAALSFLVFWLGFHEQVRLHQVGSHEIVIAPYYLLGCLIGMAGLVGAQQASTRADLPPPLSDAFASDSVHPLAGSDSASEEAGTDEVTAAAKRPNGSVVRRTILGGAAAVTSGVFSALQYGLVQLGRRETVGEHGEPGERFNALGSWLAAFGVSSVAWTLIVYGAAAAIEARRGRPSPPSLELGVLRIPGSAAGIFWSIANVFSVLAVLRGGNAVTIAQAITPLRPPWRAPLHGEPSCPHPMPASPIEPTPCFLHTLLSARAACPVPTLWGVGAPQINAFSLVTSGLWGMLWYREIRGRAAAAWLVAAAFTATMTVLLGCEKA